MSALILNGHEFRKSNVMKFAQVDGPDVSAETIAAVAQAMASFLIFRSRTPATEQVMPPPSWAKVRGVADAPSFTVIEVINEIQLVTKMTNRVRRGRAGRKPSNRDFRIFHPQRRARRGRPAPRTESVSGYGSAPPHPPAVAGPSCVAEGTRRRISGNSGATLQK
jgi:hypothetical protein